MWGKGYHIAKMFGGEFNFGSLAIGDQVATSNSPQRCHHTWNTGPEKVSLQVTIIKEDNDYKSMLLNEESETCIFIEVGNRVLTRPFLRALTVLFGALIP